MRTLASPAVCATSLAALLNVARSLPSALPAAAPGLFGCCDAAGQPPAFPKATSILQDCCEYP